jgi:hypothetical protein
MRFVRRREKHPSNIVVVEMLRLVELEERGVYWVKGASLCCTSPSFGRYLDESCLCRNVLRVRMLRVIFSDLNENMVKNARISRA